LGSVKSIKDVKEIITEIKSWSDIKRSHLFFNNLPKRLGRGSGKF